MLKFASRKKRSVHDRHQSRIANWPKHNPIVRQILHWPTVQTKLTIGPSGDTYEREADRVANQVMSMGEQAVATPVLETSSKHQKRGLSSKSSMPSILRKAISGRSCDSAPDKEEELVQRKKKSNSDSHGGLDHVQSGLSRNAGRGKPLDPNVRSFMEPRFGADFSNVRVHTDRAAVELSKALNAEAFTTGNDVYFNSNRYAPQSNAGKQLLAHELTHVLQQNGSGSSQLHRSSSDTVIQRFKLKGFSATDEALMKAAVPKAHAGVKKCDYPSWLFKGEILRAINHSRYDFVSDLGACGWTFPGSWYIEIGPSAFKHSSCCLLESTIAHEASHIAGYTEGYAREMECDCFNCSC